MHGLRTLCLCVALLHVCNGLLLGAFNIKTFGDKKASNTTLMDIISKIVHRYDIILIQEVRDTNLSATQKLMAHVNNGASEFKYKNIVSEPLGRSTYTERYLFLYREESVSVVSSYLFDDGCEPCGNDTFNREPFNVMFSTSTDLQKFVLIPQHTSPDFALQEVDALYDVVTDVRKHWNTNKIILLGDFNSDCNYVTSSEWNQIRLFTDKSFHWLISNDDDTTVTHTNCAYDRIVVTDDVIEGVVPGTAKVFDFQTALNLTPEMALAVSDHFPVEVSLMD
ncbi:deoxyribonuclease-1 [Eucyclogobius newberryi]|uniref:deoxyribonuclease-1 n=1 Tax=Eucyclogobius newberryi TaxID=166745 RepID=UPI003B5A4E29